MDTMKQLNEKEAIEFYDSEAWKHLSASQKASFQMNQQLLCMPFAEFHKAVEEVLGRSVLTHEFDFPLIRDELNGKVPPPSMGEIMDLIPTDKRIVIVT